MSHKFDMNSIAMFVDLYRHPIDSLQAMDYEWGLGTVTLSKKFPKWRIGYGHQLHPTARFYRVDFDLGVGKQGAAAIFRAHDPALGLPPVAEYVVGWVPSERTSELDGWLDFLNREIADRLATAASGDDAGEA